MFDIVVIGAGITGSFTASLLAKLGYRVCVLDKQVAGSQVPVVRAS